MKKISGFTLIELLIVIAIICIISSYIIPMFVEDNNFIPINITPTDTQVLYIGQSIDQDVIQVSTKQNGTFIIVNDGVSQHNIENNINGWCQIGFVNYFRHRKITYVECE